MKPSVTLNGARIAWTERGDGEPVLLLHPMLFSGKYFDSIVGAIAQERFRVVCPDLPDHGESVAEGGRVDIASMTRTAAEFIGACGLEHCHVVGASLGGFIALRLLVEHGPLVRSAVLMSASAGGETYSKRLKYLLMAKAARLCGTPAVAPYAAKMMLGSASLASERGPMLRTMVEAAIAANHADHVSRMVRAVVDRDDVRREARRAVTVPVLGIVGDDDDIRDTEEMREMLGPMSNAALRVLPKCGHLAVLEQPAQCRKHIVSFLRAGHDAGDRRGT